MMVCLWTDIDVMPQSCHQKMQNIIGTVGQSL